MIIDGEEYPSKEHYLEALRRELLAMSDRELLAAAELQAMLIEAGKDDEDVAKVYEDEVVRRTRLVWSLIKSAIDEATAKLN